MSKDALTITDQRNNKTYELPIENGTVRAIDLRQIKINPDDFGMMTYDPAFMNTASCNSRITYIDGDKGILRYRGYPIEKLAENCTYPGGRVPASVRRAADRPSRTRTGATRSRSTPWCMRPSSNSWTASATMPTPWACWSARRGAFHLLSGRQEHLHPANRHKQIFA